MKIGGLNFICFLNKVNKMIYKINPTYLYWCRYDILGQPYVLLHHRVKIRLIKLSE